MRHLIARFRAARIAYAVTEIAKAVDYDRESNALTAVGGGKTFRVAALRLAAAVACLRAGVIAGNAINEEITCWTCGCTNSPTLHCDDPCCAIDRDYLIGRRF